MTDLATHSFEMHEMKTVRSSHFSRPIPTSFSRSLLTYYTIDRLWIRALDHIRPLRIVRENVQGAPVERRRKKKEAGNNVSNEQGTTSVDQTQIGLTVQWRRIPSVRT